MSIRQCRAVKAISEHGSFAAAARALNMTPSALSMQVTGFEESLGVALFDRSRRPPRLTEAGRLLLSHANLVVDEYDKMIDLITHGASARGTLRLGVIPTVLTNVLPTALLALRERGSAPVLRITSALSGELVAALERGEIDLALMHAPEALAPGFVWRRVAEQRIVVVAPADSPETDLHALFAAHPYIRFNRAAWVAPMIERRMAELGLVAEAQAEIQSIEAIRLLIGLGFGVSVLPAVATPLDQGRLRLLPFGDPPLSRSIGFAMRESLARRSIAGVLTETFVAAAEDCAER